MTESHPTKYFHALDDGRVQCDACPRACKMHEGQRGLCFVRGVEGGEVRLYTYGRSSGFCVDPIEKKPLNHFLPGSSVLSFGTAGCNLACKFCQNWDMSKSREMDTLADRATPEMLAAAAKRLGCSSVAYTYNDPVIFMEYAMDVADVCHEHGVKSVAVTAGYMCAEPRAEFYRHMDAANVDLKAFTEAFYRKICGGELARRTGNARVSQARDERLVRDHDAADPGRERLGRRDRSDDAMDHEQARSRRAPAFHGVSSGLEDARQTEHAARDADARPRHGAPKRPALRVHRATCTIRRVRARTVRAARRESSSATGTNSVNGRLHLTAPASAVGRTSPACSTERPGRWGRMRLPVRLSQHAVDAA